MSELSTQNTAMLAVFFNELGDNAFLSKQKKKDIQRIWKELDPDLTQEESLRKLTQFEREYYDKVGQWKTQQLASRITKQIMDLQDQLQAAQTRGEVQRLSILLDRITKSNDLLAKVNHVYDSAPIASITINTSVNTDELIKSLNKEL